MSTRCRRVFMAGVTIDGGGAQLALASSCGTQDQRGAFRTGALGASRVRVSLHIK